MAERPASPTVRRKELANTLRALRIRAGLTLEEAARHLETSAATVSRIETGIRVPRARDVRDLLEFYGLTDEQATGKIVALVAEAKEAGWWETFSEVDEEYGTYIGFEAAASEVEEYQNTVIPALLQTGDYTRAYLQALSNSRAKPYSSHDISKLLEIRERRQQLLGTAFSYSTIVDEAALCRLVGGPAVMRAQLRHLIERAGDANISVRVLPFVAGAHPGQQGNFSILTLPQEAVPDVIYVESSAGEIFLDGHDDVQRYRRTWQMLESSALDETESLEALKSRAAGTR